jgi:hypothetical protein
MTHFASQHQSLLQLEFPSTEHVGNMIVPLVTAGRDECGPSTVLTVRILSGPARPCGPGSRLAPGDPPGPDVAAFAVVVLVVLSSSNPVTKVSLPSVSCPTSAFAHQSVLMQLPC